MSEQCICAAIQLPNGEVWRGHRHDDCIHTAAKAGATRDEIAEAEQGFITSLNRFVDREEGARLQRLAGIVSAHSGHLPRPMLFSEDLYLRAWRSAPSIQPSLDTCLVCDGTGEWDRHDTFPCEWCEGTGKAKPA
jgi:hypothetical protein